MWLAILSDQLEIVSLVSPYLTNYLIPLGLIKWQVASYSPTPLVLRHYAVLPTVSRGYPPPFADSQALLTRPPLVSRESNLPPRYRSTCMC